jgi:hypothetical protein
VSGGGQIVAEEGGERRIPRRRQAGNGKRYYRVRRAAQRRLEKKACGVDTGAPHDDVCVWHCYRTPFAPSTIVLAARAAAGSFRPFLTTVH